MIVRSGLSQQPNPGSSGTTHLAEQLLGALVKPLEAPIVGTIAEASLDAILGEFCCSGSVRQKTGLCDGSTRDSRMGLGITKARLVRPIRIAAMRWTARILGTCPLRGSCLLESLEGGLESGEGGLERRKVELTEL